MEPTVTPRNAQFGDVISGLFHEFMKAAGTMMPVKNHERVRAVGDRFASVIEFHAERKAVEVARKLQTAVSEAFNAYEAEIKELKARLDRLEGVGDGK